MEVTTTVKGSSMEYRIRRHDQDTGDSVLLTARLTSEESAKDKAAWVAAADQAHGTHTTYTIEQH